MKTLNKTQLNAIHRITTKKHKSFSTLRGVLHNDGNLIASDGHILMTVNAQYDEKHEGKIIDKNGNYIEGNYPSVKNVIPPISYCNEVNIESEDFYNAVKNIRSAKEYKGQKVILKINDVWFDVEGLYKLLNVFKTKEHFTFYLFGDGYEVLVMKSNDVTALAMSTFVNDKDEHFESTYSVFKSIDEALAYNAS